eukprot:scaffold52546_cov59-Phaeocystis_antarctica.AAC.2
MGAWSEKSRPSASVAAQCSAVGGCPTDRSTNSLRCSRSARRSSATAASTATRQPPPRPSPPPSPKVTRRSVACSLCSTGANSSSGAMLTTEVKEDDDAAGGAAVDRARVRRHLEPAQRLALTETAQARHVGAEPRHQHGAADVVQVGGGRVVRRQSRQELPRAVG